MPLMEASAIENFVLQREAAVRLGFFCVCIYLDVCLGAAGAATYSERIQITPLG